MIVQESDMKYVRWQEKLRHDMLRSITVIVLP